MKKALVSLLVLSLTALVGCQAKTSQSEPKQSEKTIETTVSFDDGKQQKIKEVRENIVLERDILDSYTKLLVDNQTMADENTIEEIQADLNEASVLLEKNIKDANQRIQKLQQELNDLEKPD